LPNASRTYGLLIKEPVVNTLNLEKQTQILSPLVEGSSIRSNERVTGVHRDTIVRLLARAGDLCSLCSIPKHKRGLCMGIRILIARREVTSIDDHAAN
jgi:hypothetical protein